ncbi:hypothetical protein TOTORO_03160 [Serratia phage vB_SmaS-Totoro]|nr:hypothetical protein TOTORO_03160 [Serratia phage vB_SmaS-Totoro]
MTINRDAIMQELLKSRPSDDVIKCIGLSRPHALKEYFTYGIHASRQSGSSRWIIEQLIKDPKAFVIVINSDFKDDFLRMGYKYPQVFGGTIPVPNLVQVGIDAGNQKTLSKRIYTAKDLVLGKVDLPIDVSAVFFDCFDNISSRVNMTKYYEMLATRTDNDPITWLIN